MTDKKPKLLIVTQHFYPENFKINDLALGLIDLGYQIDILCGHPNYPVGEWFEGYDGKNPSVDDFNGVTVYRCREVRRKGNTPVRIFLNYVSWPISAYLKARKLRKGYDAILCYNTSPVLMIWPAAKAAKVNGCPLITYVLDLWPENLYSVLPIKSKGLRSIAVQVSDYLYKKSNAIITMSRHMKDRLVDRIGDNRLYYVIPQHAEDFYAEPVSSSSLAKEFEGKTVMLFAGNLSPAQNLDMVIEASVGARAGGFESLFFLILGDGMSLESLMQQTAALGAEEYIKFLGRVDAHEVPRYAAMADALLLPLSPSEDLSLTVPGKLASYMATGRPIIASLDGAPAEIIEEAECGLVCRAGDAEALSNLLLEFSSLECSARMQMGQRAKAFYEANFKRDSCVKKLDDAIILTIMSKGN